MYQLTREVETNLLAITRCTLFAFGAVYQSGSLGVETVEPTRFLVDESVELAAITKAASSKSQKPNDR